mgnify:FL=1
MNILCFGDSLTSGYIPDARAHPYSLSLQRHFQNSAKPVSITTEGYPGDTVLGLGQFQLRLEATLAEADDFARPFNWVIIMGGTNDLGRGARPADVVVGLVMLWDMAKEHGAKVLVLSILEMVAESDPGHRQKCLEFSDILKKTAADPVHDVMFFDLRAAFPYHSLSGADKKRLFADGLHPTAEGYDRIGELLAAHILCSL